MKERLLAGLFGLLLSNAGAAAEFLVEVRVLVQRGCMLVTQARDAARRLLGESTWVLRRGWMARRHRWPGCC